MALMPLDQDRLEAGLQALAFCEPKVADVLAAIGPPRARVREPGFTTLLQIVVSQQVSTKAAAAIWQRLQEGLGALTPETLLAADAEGLRELGLSRQKAGYARGLAQAVLDGELDLPRLVVVDDEMVIEEITKLKGFGRWSAEIYLLFALGRADAWQAGDLAIQAGLQRLLELDSRPKKRPEIDALVEHWRPWRGCGALLLWHYYGATTLTTKQDAG